MKSRHVVRIVGLMLTTGVLFNAVQWQFAATSIALGVAVAFGLISFFIEASDEPIQPKKF